ncbi:hypothetical protein F5B21DRAFT_500468 [Xylaria acuta]|nr:hypothetical protein F5B21DRAFT_500468 [Xylaria acuta]
MPALPVTSSRSSTESIDSFITQLNIAADDYDNDGGLSVLEQRKKLSHENKKRPDNDRGSVWTNDMQKHYDKYKEQSDKITTTKKEFDKSKSKLERYQKHGAKSPQRLQELRKNSLEKAEAWSDAGVAGCKKRLSFMVKFRNVFNPKSTKGHIQQAEDNLKSARSARTAAQMLQA